MTRMKNMDSEQQNKTCLIEKNKNKFKTNFSTLEFFCCYYSVVLLSTKHLQSFVVS